MKDLTVIMDDQPGKLADLGEATGRAGVNIAGLCAMVGDGRGFIHILVDDEVAARKALDEAGISVADEREAVVVDLHDKPGAMGEIARDLAEAGVNIDVAYTIFTGVRLVILTEDVEAAREALDLNGAAG
ncbi:MAG TPA: ACT domain-containing protein [Solirubrobacterales bacterium]|nr:ACT domain-containing protein [Solirubrobacterales bacterium]